MPSGGRLAADVLIVGAGAAGITLARSLAARGHQVLLVESGGFEYHPPTQDLYRGPAEGEALEPGNEYLSSSRLRYVGGSSNHWAGFCRPLDASDFERRPWVSESGWPIGESDLATWYGEAAAVLGVSPFPEVEQRGAGGLALPADSPLATPLFHFSRVQHRRTYGAELDSSERIRLVTWANVAEIALAPDGTAVDHVKLATLEGGRFEARARITALAAGGIENARLLLASRSVHREGVGNAHDLVGRYFMDHPHRRLGELILTRPPSDLRLWEYWMGPSKREMPMLHPSAELQRRFGIGNVLVRIVEERGRTAESEALAPAVAAIDRLRRPDDPGRAVVMGFLYAQGEQVPNPASRVRLSEERDALGTPRAHLEWRLTAQDHETLTRASRIVATELGRTALGRATLLGPADGWEGTVEGNHHMGTTRMAASPRAGVVDADCRVFGVANLFVAGSSVFSTSGAVNPTFTITALALRLAGRIDRELTGA